MGADLEPVDGMLPMLLFIAVVLGLFLRKLTPDERIQLVHKTLALTRTAIALARRFATSTPVGCEDFDAALRVRTRRTVVAPVLLIAWVTLYVVMLFRGSGLDGEQLLLHWGGSVGPRTTNGEWWRLLTAMFVHWGLLHLIADVVGLAQVGRLTERLVGPTTFAFVFVAAGLISGLRELSVHPVAVSAGASGGVFGVYGLLIATGAWGWVWRSPLTIPVAVLKRCCPAAVVFLIYHLAAEGFTESMTWGTIVGLACGAILAFGIDEHKPPVRWLCTSMAATLAIIVVFAAPLRGMADVTREMGAVIELERRTAAAYDAEVVHFRRGHQSAEALADIAAGIESDVRATRASLSAIMNVPAQQQTIVNDALEYLRLREESWHLRAEGLRKGRLQTLQRADRVESDAKRLFEGVEKLKSGKVEE
ncbi:MAG TPA: rhomboid family intramembrane serine protease [Vicinamibacterales bacterium]|nr:rhomboid family intramembrane serine protease [Vicinamibacterales bacterium]